MAKVVSLDCLRCGTTYAEAYRFQGCEVCAAQGIAVNLTPRYDNDRLANDLRAALRKPALSMWDFDAALPIDRVDAVTLGEGMSALVPSPAVGAWVGVDRVWVKDESRNPTWSHKDRLNSVAISHARKTGAKIITVSSSGNHGVSAVAYASAAGLRTVIFALPHAPAAMVAMMREFGAIVIATEKFEGRWIIMREAVEKLGWYPTGNFMSPAVGGNLYGIEGLKTISYEIWQQLGQRTPDWVVAPSLLADILYGIGRGFQEIETSIGKTSPPRLVAAERFGPTAHALANNLEIPVPVPAGSTIATSIGGAQTTYLGLHAVKQSRGVGTAVSEEEILEARRALARLGWLVETSSAAAFAAVKNLVKNGTIARHESVVIVSTSSGMKDLAEVTPNPAKISVIEPTLANLETVLKRDYGLKLDALT